MDFQAIRKKRARFVVGLMSGTSCDGVDSVLIRIKGTGKELAIKFIAHKIVPAFAAMIFATYLRTAQPVPTIAVAPVPIIVETAYAFPGKRRAPANGIADGNLTIVGTAFAFMEKVAGVTVDSSNDPRI